MIKEFEINGLKCVCMPFENIEKVAYLIYPGLEPFKEEWLREMCQKFKVPLAVIYIPASGWNDMLTPWPEPGETPDSPPFAGHASSTLQIIKENVIPLAEKTLGIESVKERNLIGVSLSGLFTLWQWMLCDVFHSIASLSGSFWYPGFIDWFEAQKVPSKTGEAYFLLGVKEPKAWIKAYRSVGTNTEKIVEKLQDSGISTKFEWVPGDHFADPLTRVVDAFQYLYPETD